MPPPVVGHLPVGTLRWRQAEAAGYKVPKFFVVVSDPPVARPTSLHVHVVYVHGNKEKQVRISGVGRTNETQVTTHNDMRSCTVVVQVVNLKAPTHIMCSPGYMCMWVESSAQVQVFLSERVHMLFHAAACPIHTLHCTPTCISR